MHRLIALAVALALTLAMAAPVAANQKVWIGWPHSDSWEFEVPLSDQWLGFQCTGPVYYGGYGSADLWLWYKNSVDTTDPNEYMPDGRAWPWIKGKAVGQGLDYFSSAPGMSGKVISGKWKVTTNLSRHHLGTPGDPNDLESWRESSSGVDWGIRAPGYGTVFQITGNGKGTATVVEQVPGPFDVVDFVEDERGHRGNETWRPDKLCAFFGYEVAP